MLAWVGLMLLRVANTAWSHSTSPTPVAPEASSKVLRRTKEPSAGDCSNSHQVFPSVRIPL